MRILLLIYIITFAWVNTALCSTLYPGAVLSGGGKPGDSKVTIVLCKGSGVQVEAGAGTNYAWSPGTWLSDSTIANPWAFPDSTITYFVTYNDLGGNPRTDSINIIVKPRPEITLSDTSVCPDDSVELDAGNPGSTYVWSTGETTQFITVSPGMYFVSVTNSSGCGSNKIINVTAKPQPVVNIPDQSICTNETAQLDAGNTGSQYDWSTGEFSQVITVTAGTFYVTVTNTDHCTATDSCTITTKQTPTVTVADREICSNQSVTLDAANAGTLQVWSTGDSSRYITVNTGGQYSVTVTNYLGCTDSDTCTVTVYQAPQVSIADTNFCPGENVQLDPGNIGTGYIWSTGQTTQAIDVTAQGYYSVTVTDSNHCTDSDTAYVTQKPQPVVSIPDQSSCTNETVQLDADNAGCEYDWSTGDNTQVITAGVGTYSVTVTNSDGCTDTTTCHVIQKTTPAVNLHDTVICSNQSVTLNAGNTGSLQVWSTGDSTQTIIVSTAGQYSVTVTNYLGCTDTDTCTVAVNQAPEANLPNVVWICPGEDTQLDAGINNVQYLWSNGATSQEITVSTEGFYFVTVTDTNQCKGYDTVYVDEKPKPDSQLPDTVIKCPNETVELNTYAPGYTYQWSTGSQNEIIFVTAQGSYTVTVYNSESCYDIDTCRVINRDAPVVSLQDKQICPGESTTLDAGNAGFDYIWSTGATTQKITVSSPGTYSVTVTNGQNCSDSDTCTVTEKEHPEVQLTDASSCKGVDVTLDAGNPGSTYEWSTGATTQTISVSTAGSYSVVVSNTSSCTGSDTATIVINECTDKYNVGVPNAFSPNGDGLNDILYVEGYGVDELEFFVYNRWGQLVFSSTDLENGWDGTFKGVTQDTETYVYWLRAKFTDGKSVFKKGNITLLN